MKKTYLSLLIVSLVPLFFTACPKRKPLPTPKDTAVGTVGGRAQGIGGADRNVGDTYSAGEGFNGGLQDRGAGFSTLDGFNNSNVAYDKDGNPITVYDKDGNPISPYDESGNLRKLYDANGNPITAYDANGNPLPAFNPSATGGSSSLPYDPSQVVGQVLFGYDQFYISPDARQSLSDVKSYLDSNPSAKVLLVGHCSWHGTADYNLLLGDKRANTVFDYLTNLGVSSSRMETLSRGDLDATEGGTKEATAQDRRVDVVKVN